MKQFIFVIDLKSMCDTYQSFEELIEEKDDPRHLLDTLESKSIESIVVPLEYYLCNQFF
jgi:hypothetical protein